MMGKPGRGTEVGEALYRFGDQIQVDVGADYTRFAVEGLSSHLDAILAGLGARLGEGRYRRSQRQLARPNAGRKGTRKEKPVDEDESLRWFRAWMQFDGEMEEAVYGEGHAYAEQSRFRGGYGNAELEAFRRDYYGASNGVLIITGQFDVELTKKHVRYWFQALPAGAVHWITRSPLPRSPGTHWVAVDSVNDSPTTEIRIACGTAPDPAATGARLVLAEMLRQRVWVVRQKLGAAYLVDAKYIDNIGPGRFEAIAVVDSARVAEAVAAMVVALEGLRGHGDDELAADFVRARRRSLEALLADHGGARARASRLAYLAERGLDLDYYTNLARAVAGLTLDDMRSVIARDLATTQVVFGVFGPKAALDAAREQVGDGQIN